MKVLDRINLIIFSVIILIISLTVCILISGWLELKVAFDVIETVLSNEISGPITLGIAILLIILSIKSIFFNSYAKEKSKEGILLENENGKLLVSKDTIENLSTAVIKNYNSIENSTTKVDVDAENKISIFITLSVYSEAVIKDLAAKIQTNVKDEVKKSLDLEIKEVNIRIKNINPKKENVVKE